MYHNQGLSRSHENTVENIIEKAITQINNTINRSQNSLSFKVSKNVCFSILILSPKLLLIAFVKNVINLVPENIRIHSVTAQVITPVNSILLFKN